MENRSESQPRCNSMQENQFNVLTAEHRSRIVVPAHDHKTHVGSGCLCRWRITRESRSGIGVVIDGSASGTIKIKKWIGHQDNNVAEYAALLEALQLALELGARTLHVSQCRAFPSD